MSYTANIKDFGISDLFAKKYVCPYTQTSLDAFISLSFAQVAAVVERKTGEIVLLDCICHTH